MPASAAIVPPEDDEVLMQRYRDGELAAFESLYARHKDALYRYLLRGCTQPEAAAEMFQDVWASLIRTRHRYEPRAKFSTWLYRIAHNRLIDHWRLQPRAPLPLDEEMEIAAAEHERPDMQALAQERGRRLRQALGDLPIEQREAFLLHEEGGLTLEQIAEVNGVGRETIKSRLRYALAKLRGALSDV
jgi:RNA polymerase sigma-70 factor (ECF subfamily)